MAVFRRSPWSQRCAAPAGWTLLLCCLLAATRKGAAQSISDFAVSETIPVHYICSYVTETNAKNHTKACDLVTSLASGLVALPDDVCPDYADTGYGKQVQPLAQGSNGQLAPVPLTVPSSIPAQFNQRGQHSSLQYKFQSLLSAEGATYNWMWQVIRNIKWYWPCSKLLGGSSPGYLVPTGWEMVGSDPAAPGAPAGVYTLPQNGRRYPIMVILKHASTRHLVVAIRGSNTKLEWARNFMYNRTLEHPFALNNGSDTAKIPGETHVGFTLGFDALWPHVRTALQAEVAAAGGNIKAITLTGHSQGAAVATMLSYAVQTFLVHRNINIKAGLVTFGGPLVGDSRFAASINAAVNIRRIAFENDPFTILPCASAKDAKQASMPACANTLVPTVDTAGSGRDYWSDYQHPGGEIMVRASDMPVQTDVWIFTNHIKMTASKGLVAGVHGCPYICFFRQFSSGDLRNNNCLMKRVPEDSPLLTSNGYCQGFPNDGDDWPTPAIDRQLLTDTSVFPAAGARPPMWNFRTYADSRSWSCSTAENNMMTVEVRHKPIPGVTPEMLFWLYNNMQGASVINGTKYPNFLLFHPRDHVYYWTSHTPFNSPAAKHSKLTPMTNWREFQATGCKETGDMSAPYVCPSGPNVPNPGVTKATKPGDYLKLSIDHVNGTSVVRIMESNKIQFAVRGCSRAGCAWSVRTEHSWEATPDGLAVTTRQEIGLRWKLATKGINPRIVNAWRNGVAPDKKCNRVALHFIEEYGGLQHWLPAAFQQAQGKAPASPAALYSAASVDDAAPVAPNDEALGRMMSDYDF